MRIEATIPDSRGSAIQELARELGLSRSQVVDEALALFLKAVLEIRRGRRLVTHDPNDVHATCELTTPTLTAIEWAMSSTALELPPVAVARIAELVNEPPEAGLPLRRAAKRHGQ